jgi:RNA polymerase sigma factor (TIGR02999 family)
MSEVTRILSAIEQGDPNAAEQLLPLVYDELRRLAAQKLARESPGQTLQATALVHEAYLRLVGGPSEASTPVWSGRGHFFAAAAEAMRRILVDQARHKRTVKAGGDRQRIELTNNIDPAVPETDAQLLAVHDALDRLEAADKRKADLVKLRFFVGLTIEEAAQALGISVSTATTDWAYARCWLRLEVLGVQDLKAT